MLIAVSLGPGDESLLAPAARKALERAEVIVGYKGYIDLVSPELLEGKEVFSTGMTGEVERVNRAVDFAAEGRFTAVVCSGDAGIYAMAGLMLETLEARGLLERVDFEVVPGIPAFAAAAALLGAPLMHDFASVSLSDLLTPWETIEKRLRLAAEADFVLAIYNPRSRKRSGHLQKALDIVGQVRSPQTPVGLVKQAARPGQEVLTSTLGEFDPGLVDMQSLVIIGNSSTRLAGERMLTPRGYHTKYQVG
ncbi:precorrin-3B C(17)-methyltransferase [Salidesulfovibrio onnuriiensis]|uniref:precorrin-3B C(17)-methyltransferase n=1 Tax=Salidesulfovibrio onnuriiensis TaxID=2583823 RepID=UPI0011C71765|nr:precorrin-3B C(17)-methyltransferase [Salidesulfovibrio onnuriiensis]